MNVGDEVRLKSGGCPMLIVEVLADGHVVCAWRDNAGVHEWTLPGVCVTPCDET